jgi:hypothetical protein
MTLLPPPTGWIIDDDRSATDELTLLLQVHRLARVVGTSTSIAGWLDHSVDCLFIRITCWDDYLKIAGFLPRTPTTVIFLSGRGEKCTHYLPGEVDFHLQPPYGPGAVRAIFNRRKDPFFERRSLEFFFLKANCRYHVIYFSTLQDVRGKAGWITIRTDTEEYTVAGTLAEFQRRLPVPSNRVGRGLLLIHF